MWLKLWRCPSIKSKGHGGGIWTPGQWQVRVSFHSCRSQPVGNGCRECTGPEAGRLPVHNEAFLSPQSKDWREITGCDTFAHPLPNTLMQHTHTWHTHPSVHSHLPPLSLTPTHTGLCLTHAPTYLSTHTHTCPHAQGLTYAHTYIPIGSHMCTHSHMPTHTHFYRLTHVHIHTYVHIFP